MRWMARWIKVTNRWGRDYDQRRRDLNREADWAMDDAKAAKDQFKRALQPRGGCAVAALAVLAGSATMWRIFEGVV